MYVDAHNHLYYAEDVNRLVEESVRKGVTKMLTAGEDVSTSTKCVEISDGKHVFSAVGIHPYNASKASEDDVKQIEKLLEYDTVIAIGEIGLDKKYEQYGVIMDIQESVFLKMVSIAKEYDLPIVVHSGRSYKRVAELIQGFENNILMHWYSGSIKTALELTDTGNVFFSFGPAAVKYDNYRGLISVLPEDVILTETDYPVKIGGEENNPVKVRDVVKRISDIKNIPVEKVIRHIYRNFERFAGV